MCQSLFLTAAKSTWSQGIKHLMGDRWSKVAQWRSAPEWEMGWSAWTWFSGHDKVEYWRGYQRKGISGREVPDGDDPRCPAAFLRGTEWFQFRHWEYCLIFARGNSFFSFPPSSFSKIILARSTWESVCWDLSSLTRDGTLVLSSKGIES